MSKIQAVNDGVDDKDFEELVEILKGFGDVEVLYNPDDPKDKDITDEEVVKRYERFARKYRKSHDSRVQGSNAKAIRRAA